LHLFKTKYRFFNLKNDLFCTKIKQFIPRRARWNTKA
jgi:hypothetical protein